MLLLVRHGPGRGRDYPYLQSCFVHLEQQMPELFKRIRLYETGSPEPSLSGVRAVIFWLADSLRAFYPECFEEAMRIATFKDYPPRMKAASFSLDQVMESLNSTAGTQ